MGSLTTRGYSIRVTLRTFSYVLRLFDLKGKISRPGSLVIVDMEALEENWRGSVSSFFTSIT